MEYILGEDDEGEEIAGGFHPRTMNIDGTRSYYQEGNFIHECSLSMPWDISTEQYLGIRNDLVLI